jgi:glycine oxidase
MRADILIIGQGLAGTMLAWEFERAGIPFSIADGGHANATTAAGAGIINPITGQRLVKSWHFETLMPVARIAYQELERTLGVSLWREMRVRRFFAHQREREMWEDKSGRENFAAFVESADDSGIWIRDAARVDLGALLNSSRARWHAEGRLQPMVADWKSEVGRHELVIDCGGQASAGTEAFSFLPWEYSKGELIEIAVEGMARDVVLNRGHWVLPTGPAIALVGATHQPGLRDSTLTDAARVSLETSARELLGPERPFRVVGQRAGVRVHLPDKRPAAGRHPQHSSLGVVNGLGGKGALWAPMLARQWVNHLTEGVPFDPEIDVARFAR